MKDKYEFADALDELIQGIARHRFQLSRLPEGSPNPDAARRIAEVRTDLQSQLGDLKLLLEIGISQRIDEVILNLTSTPTSNESTTK